MYFAESLGLEFLAPQGAVGLLILVTGLIFSLMMFYVGYISIREMYSNESQNSRKIQILKEQKEKIARLYPQA
jgi:hypothetical protein|tara:strand:+ start:1025 stop:1243 length:219 start_codon:yes stop_codon:yes gene_type:complete